jgi:hypothetical protein
MGKENIKKDGTKESKGEDKGMPRRPGTDQYKEGTKM